MNIDYQRYIKLVMGNNTDIRSTSSIVPLAGIGDESDLSFPSVGSYSNDLFYVIFNISNFEPISDGITDLDNPGVDYTLDYIFGYGQGQTREGTFETGGVNEPLSMYSLRNFIKNYRTYKDLYRSHPDFDNSIISTIVGDGSGNITVTTSTDHGLVDGDTVRVSLTGLYDGSSDTGTVNVSSTTQFSYDLSGNSETSLLSSGIVLDGNFKFRNEWFTVLDNLEGLISRTTTLTQDEWRLFNAEYA